MAKSDGDNRSNNAARRVGPTIRRGGRAGKDTFTEAIEDFFRALLGHKVRAVLVAAVALAALLAVALAHKSSVERAQAAQAALQALRDEGASPQLDGILHWLERNAGAEGEIEVRLLLIHKYIELAKDGIDPAKLDLARAELTRLKDDFDDHPMMTARLYVGEGPEGSEHPIYLDHLAGEIATLQGKLGSGFAKRFREPEPMPAAAPQAPPDTSDEAAAGPVDEDVIFDSDAIPAAEAPVHEE